MLKQNDCLQIQSRFGSFEEFSQTLQGWGTEFTQIDCGLFCADIHQVVTPEVIILDASLNRRLIQCGTQPTGMRSFVIMAESATPFIWRKQEVTKDCLMVFPKGAELDASSLGGFHVYTLSLAEHLVEERLFQKMNPALTIKLNQGGLWKVKTSKLQALRCFVVSVTSEVKKRPELLTQPGFRQRLCDELLSYIFDSLNFSQEKILSLPFRKHARIVQGIEEWVREADTDGFSVNNLCKTLHVNERTLQRIFEQWYGVSPQQYLLAIRLNGVKRELRGGFAATTKISDIANLWGFWHMGKFAYYYRRQFFELPSETLASHRHK